MQGLKKDSLKKKILKLKGTFSDSNNIYILCKSEDIYEKRVISSISVDSNFGFASYA